jgi:outer membrane murein-binding lipoprotein Lpp
MRSGENDVEAHSENKMTKMHTKSTRRALTALVAAAIALAGCAAQGPSTPAGLEQKIEQAVSRVDHEDIAAQYERQAELDAAAAKRHQGYAATYLKNRAPRSGPEAHLALAKHCEALAQTYRQASEQNLEMAKLHRELAAQAK